MRYWIIAGLLAGCSGAPVVSRTALVGGQPAAAGQFPATEWGIGCSGVKIGPRQFLTAGHCVMADQKTRAVDFGVGPAGDDFAHHRYQEVTVESIDLSPTLHGDTDGGDSDVSSDLAVVVIKEATSAPVAPLRRTKLAVGERVILNGWGCQDLKDFDEPDWKTFQLKFSEKRVSQVGPFVASVPGVDADGRTASTGCSGDSGGPVYARDAAGALAVVGINHALGTGALDLPVEQIPLLFERVDDEVGGGAVAAWIRSFLPAE